MLLRAGHKPDVVVIGAAPGDAELPSAAALRAAHDVVVRVDRGNRRPIDHLERLGIRSARVETSAATEDVALLLAHAGDASVIVGVGTHATLDEFLDRQRHGLASTYLTRLLVGQRLVDAAAVPTLYSGRLRPRHLFLALLVGLLALGAAIATTPAGAEWAEELWTWLRTLVVEHGVVLVTLVRRHLVGAVALVMALAIGIALGSGPLSHEALLPSSGGPGADRGRVRPPDRPRTTWPRPRPPPSTAPGSRVAPSRCCRCPGVGTRDARRAAGGDRGGRTAPSPARWSAGQALVGAGEKALVDTLGSQLARAARAATAPTRTPPAYERMGQLLGTAIATVEPRRCGPGHRGARPSGRASTRPAC